MRLVLISASLLGFAASALDMSAPVSPRFQIQALRDLKASDLPGEFWLTCQMGLRTIGDQDSPILRRHEVVEVAAVETHLSGLADPQTMIRLVVASGQNLTHLSFQLPGDRRFFTYWDLESVLGDGFQIVR